MNKRSLTHRERWLLAFFPAALIVVVSFFIPNGSTKRAQLERLVDAAPSDSEVHREMSELGNHRYKLRASLKSLEAIIAETNEQIALLQAPIGRVVNNNTEPIAQRFRHLVDALGRRGITLLESKLVREEQTPHEPPYQIWALTLVGSWPQMQSALNDTALVPSSLRVDSLSLESASERSALRRWRLIVAAQPMAKGEAS